MAEYVAPAKGGAICEQCGVLVPAYRVMPPGGGWRVRYHHCTCGWQGKSVEKSPVEYWHLEGQEEEQDND